MDLELLYDQLYEEYFRPKGRIFPKPKLRWSKNKWPRLLGKYHASLLKKNGIIEVSRKLQDRREEWNQELHEKILGFVLYHLMIHHYLFGNGITTKHTVQFYKLEQEYKWYADVFWLKVNGKAISEGLDRDFLMWKGSELAPHGLFETS